MFVCSRCTKKFKTKFNLNRHMEDRINPCDDKKNNKRARTEDREMEKETHSNYVEPVDKFQGLNTEIIECEHCKKTFSSQSNLDRHWYNSPNTPCAVVRAMKETLKESLKESVVPVLVPSTVNINNTNNNIVQPMFVKPGKEDIDHITREVLLGLLDSNSFTNMCSDLMRLLYFNRNVPQNNNWMIAYPRNGQAGVAFNYDTNEFERKSTKDMIDDKFANMVNLLQPLIEEIYKEDERDHILNGQQKKNITRYYAHFGMMQISKESPEVYERIHEMAFNYKTIPMASWKEQGLTGNHLSIKF